MWIANDWKDYEVIDTSGGEKLEGLYPASSGPTGDLGYSEEK